jgi:hypothetical protein
MVIPYPLEKGAGRLEVWFWADGLGDSVSSISGRLFLSQRQTLFDLH